MSFIFNEINVKYMLLVNTKNNAVHVCLVLTLWIFLWKIIFMFREGKAPELVCLLCPVRFTTGSKLVPLP